MVWRMPYWLQAVKDQDEMTVSEVRLNYWESEFEGKRIGESASRALS